MYNIRVDKISLAGVWLGAASSRETIYTRTWSNVPATVTGWGAVNCSYPTGLYQDGTNLYIATAYTCNNGNAYAVSKMSLATGTMVGWKGAIRAGSSPDGGDPGCAGATNITPGWCKNGAADRSYRLGQFAGGLYGISGDNYFLYLTDDDSHRVTRVPK